MMENLDLQEQVVDAFAGLEQLPQLKTPPKNYDTRHMVGKNGQ